ncbi:MAG: NHLP bacteriocin export ABC transporter permease/ATPase subunit [Methylococcales bacterium]|nr:NHLP bacteriocin export ABC transporter permease/ATPase subunit [Methylococcales bacterium]
MNMPRLLAYVESNYQATSGKPYFWADGKYEIYLIKKGEVDCFIQKRDDYGDPQGYRDYIFRSDEGSFFPGFNCSEDNFGVIAVPLPGSLIYKINMSHFSQSFCQPEIRTEFCDALQTWIKQTTDRHIDKLPPKTYTAIHRGEKLKLKKGSVVSASYGIRWVSVKKGSFIWNDQKSLPLVDKSTPAIPLSARMWLHADSDAIIEAIDIDELFCSNAIWESICQFYQLLLLHIDTKNHQQVQLEVERLGTKSDQSNRLANEAFTQLLSIITDQIDDSTRRDDGNSLMSALDIIGEQINVKFKEPFLNEQDEERVNLIDLVAEQSNVRYRQVMLKDDWWLTDNGPLLVNVNETKHWVALLTNGKGQYELHDPVNKIVKQVNQKIALKLNSTATSFYRAFPNKKLSPIDLLMFGIQGMKSDIMTVLFIGFLTGLLGMVMPIAIGKVVESIIPSGERDTLWMMGGALFATVIATSLIGLTRSIAVLRIESKMNHVVQAAVWDRVLKLPVSFFRQFTSGDLATRINGINTIRQALAGNTITIILSGIFSIFNYFLLFHYSTELALIATLLILIALVLVFTIGLMKLKHERLITTAQGLLTGTIFEYLTGITKIRVSAAENQAFYNWSTRFSNLRLLSFKAAHLANIEKVFFSGYSVITSAVLFTAMGMALTSNSETVLTSGEFIAFNAAFGVFFGGLMSLSRTLLMLLNLVPIYERVKPILQTIPEVSDSKVQIEDLQGWVEVSQINFQYPDGPQILHDISFSIQPGESVALVGPSGSGKSTLLRLLLGFETASSGSIKYDFQDISDLDFNTLRKQLGVVLQTGQLITGDIYSNVVGASSLTLDDAWDAVRMVGLEEDVKQMPMGMQTLISEGASTLSVGQRQRILIARAIITRPRVLFFDEATSALDNETQATVSKSMDELKATRIIIAHRLSTIINADRILVLDNGKIVQQGTYQQLIKEKGLFLELVKRQIV